MLTKSWRYRTSQDREFARNQNISRNNWKRCDYNGTISNEAFLDAGAIQGAFELLGTLVEMGVSQKEIIQELRNTLDRAKRLEEKHPGLDFAVESGRAS